MRVGVGDKVGVRTEIRVRLRARDWGSSLSEDGGIGVRARARGWG